MFQMDKIFHSGIEEMNSKRICEEGVSVTDCLDKGKQHMRLAAD